MWQASAIPTCSRAATARGITFLDPAGEPIPIPQDSDARDERDRFTVNRIEYHPERFPTPPARVTDELLVLIRPNVERRRVDADSLPQGAGLIDNAFFTAPADDNEQPRDNARDADGRFLEQMPRIRYGHDHGWPRVAYYYYGTQAPRAPHRPGRRRARGLRV